MIFENMICLSYLGCSSSFTFEFIIHEQCDMHSVSLYMPQGRAHRYTLDNATGTGEHSQTQMKSRVQLTCNIFKITTRAQGQTRVLKLGSTQGIATA